MILLCGDKLLALVHCQGSFYTLYVYWPPPPPHSSRQMNYQIRSRCLSLQKYELQTRAFLIDVELSSEREGQREIECARPPLKFLAKMMEKKRASPV